MLSQGQDQLTVAIIPNFLIGKYDVIFLPHPRNGIQSPFLIYKNESQFYMYEILEVSSFFSKNLSSQSMINSKSFFIGNNVISDGSLLILSGIHPMIVALPYLIKKKSGFHLYDDYFKDTPYESISSYIYPFFDQFGEYDTYDGQKLWRFDEKKMLSFIEKKFDRLSTYFDIYLDNSQRVHEKTLDILRHYLPPKYVENFKCYLCEKDPEKFPKIIFGNYHFLNKMVSTEKEKEKKEKIKIPKFAYKRKKIPKYLINNRVITSFFKPQKVLA